MLNKSIESGKDWRKPYYGSKNFDLTCRNHGSCPACLSNRMHKHRKLEISLEEIRDELNDEIEFDQ